MAFAKTLKDQKVIIFCDFCFRKITKQTYFRCEDCRFDFCVICALSNIETEVHRKEHRYRVISGLEQILEENGWRLIDELLLLDGMLSFGFDNFGDIAKLLRPKSEGEVKKHLFDMIGIKDNVENEVNYPNIIKSNPNDSCVASFMSKRQEFDSEIINEYEALIEDLVFEEDDTEIEVEYKRFLLENYRTVLKRRKVWRNFILDRRITEVVKMNEKAELLDVLNKKKWIAQYLSKNDFNTFLSGLAVENRLRLQLSKHPGMFDIQDDKLHNNTKLLSQKELNFCLKLNIPTPTYIKLKRLALELFNIKTSLKPHFFELFSPNESTRANIIYKWFLDQCIVIEE